jgi:hypothetical protein
MINNEAKMISFICGCYCQFCRNTDCNVNDIMGKYQNNELTPSQMKEVSGFSFEKVSCANYKNSKEFDIFKHKIRIYYKKQKSEEIPGWFSAGEVSRLWNSEVDYIDILFTDI